MPIAPTELFAALADPARRAIFERPARDGEQTVRVLTGHAGVSQPAVSKHPAVLKLAGLVLDRRKPKTCSTATCSGDRIGSNGWLTR